MVQMKAKSVRRLVTLSPELAERVDKFRESTGTSSESEALKMLIEAGLKLRDRREDLFERCQNSTARGQSIGDVVNLLTSDHPLVASTVVDLESLIVNLKTAQGEPDERFRYSRSKHQWAWETNTGSFNNYDDNWQPIPKAGPRSSTQKAAPKTGSGLDDDIPF